MAQETCPSVIFKLYFSRFSYTNARKCARRSQLRRVISRQSLRVERQMSPFWKLDIQGYNICNNWENLEIWPWTPTPYPLNRTQGSPQGFGDRGVRDCPPWWEDTQGVAHTGGGAWGGKVRQGGMQIFPKFGHFLPFLKNMEFFMQFLYIFRNIFWGKNLDWQGGPLCWVFDGGIRGIRGIRGGF